MGSLVKHHLPFALGLALSPERIYHVSIMPCYDKKLEASRTFFSNEHGTRDVDCVLTTTEIEQMVTREELEWLLLPELSLAPLYVVGP